MNKRRLLKLAELLEADARNKSGLKFDMDMWGESQTKDMKVTCGTTACAMGLAALSGTFKRAGLQVRVQEYGHDANHIFWLDIGFKGSFASPLESASQLFDLTYAEASWLFISDDYPDNASMKGAAGERTVAKRIKRFVAGKEKPGEELDV